MVDTSLVGRCGLYCGYCSIHRAYKDSERLREEFAKLYGCLLEDVRCDGCQAVGGYVWCKEARWGKNCKMVKCLDSRGHTYCSECPEYDVCEMFEEFARDNLKMGVDVRENLGEMREGKLEDWLSGQDRKWRCPACKNPVIVSDVTSTCHWCGARLKN
jgi:hypothetical protein